MTTCGLIDMFIKDIVRVIYLGIPISNYQQLASFSQGKSKHIYKKSKATALLKYYYLISLPIVIYNQRSAVSGQQSAFSGQQLLMLITASCTAVLYHARVIHYYCVRSNIRSHRSIRSCHYCA